MPLHAYAAPIATRHYTQNSRRDAFLGVPQYSNLLLFSSFQDT